MTQRSSKTPESGKAGRKAATAGSRAKAGRGRTEGSGREASSPGGEAAKKRAAGHDAEARARASARSADVNLIARGPTPPDEDVRMMTAIRVSAHGGPEALEEVSLPVPRPGPDEALVRVRACGLNHLDVWVRRGVPGHKFPLPLIPGSDIAGTIDQLGRPHSHFRTGDRVAVSPGLSCGTCLACLSGRDPFCPSYGILGENRDGGCAEFVVVPLSNLLRVPENLSFEDAAAIPLVFLTAWHMLVDRCQITTGETVLIHAGGSGVGSAAIQIAKLWGAQVITTVGAAAKVARARELGADHVVNYKKKDFRDEVRRLTGGAGVDIVLDHVGADTFERSLKSLRNGGRLVTCGSTSGNEVTVDLRRVFYKSLSILGSTMGGKGELSRLWDFFGAGKLKPVVHKVLPMRQIRKAHQLLEDRKVFGKVVVVPESGLNHP